VSHLLRLALWCWLFYPKIISCILYFSYAKKKTLYCFTLYCFKKFQIFIITLLYVSTFILYISFLCYSVPFFAVLFFLLKPFLPFETLPLLWFSFSRIGISHDRSILYFFFTSFSVLDLSRRLVSFAFMYLAGTRVWNGFFIDLKLMMWIFILFFAKWVFTPRQNEGYCCIIFFRKKYLWLHTVLVGLPCFLLSFIY